MAKYEKKPYGKYPNLDQWRHVRNKINHNWRIIPVEEMRRLRELADEILASAERR